MGQYHLLVNLDKREYVHPHRLGVGLKLWEQLASHPSTGEALLVLLACSNGRGGGDLKPDRVIGRWAGDRIAVVGDYAEASDLPGQDAENLYRHCTEGEYLDVTPLVRRVLAAELGGRFVEKDGLVHWEDGQGLGKKALAPDSVLVGRPNKT